jgi:hypothetical protein
VEAPPADGAEAPPGTAGAAAGAVRAPVGTATIERAPVADRATRSRAPLTALRTLFQVREGIPPVPGTWLLGAVVLAAGTVVLLVSLVP